MITKKANAIKTICLLCGEKLTKVEERKGKAICEDCSFEVWNTKIQRTPTPDEFYKQKRKEEEEMFIKVMKKLFLRK